MDKSTWTVTYMLHRQKGQEPPHFDRFTLEVRPDEYVLDGVERIWAFHDRSLTFRHACHHSTCGACGMRVNGTEKLTCITRIRDVTHDGGTIKIEPLRNFPVVSDLAVNMGPLYAAMERVGFRQVVPVGSAPTQDKQAVAPSHDTDDDGALRLVDCIECGLCLSACPVSATAPNYLGPAALAAMQHGCLDGDTSLADLADSQDGVWRCHSAFECTAVCPSFVEPAWRIMAARKQVVGQRVRRLLGRKKESRR
jgi:succinate dehydrogenase / fumarate reductase iron-sulfur subunit